MGKAMKYGLCFLLVMGVCVVWMDGDAICAEVKRGGTITVGIDAGPVGWDPHMSFAFS